jgi:hypothetical protein
MVASALVAVWLSGHFRWFAQDRGMLQFLLAIPLGSLTAAALLAAYRMLTPTQMLWAMVPVGGVVFLGVGALGPGFRAWPWMVGIIAVLLVPWGVGLVIGSTLGRGRPATRNVE